MNLSTRFDKALHEVLDEGCPVVRDLDTGRRCGRRRYARRRCLACAEMTAKPLGLVAGHAAEYGNSLSGAYLEKARLAGAEFRWVNMRHARLAGAILAGADLRDADFTGADLQSADLRGADLTHARLRLVKSLRGARFDGAILEDAHLSTAENASAAEASFARADLTGANLSNAVLPGANFRGARLVGVDFRGAVLAGGDFTDADLIGANLKGATLTGATFDGARLEEARLPEGKRKEDLQKRAHEPERGAAAMAGCMRAFAGVRASSDRTRLRVLARKTAGMRREDSLELVLPILEKEDVPDAYAEEAVAALRSLGREPPTRPFLIGLLSRGAEKVRLEAASILAEPPLDAETQALFHSILASGGAAPSGMPEDEEARRSFRQGVFRALAPGVEDGDPGSTKLARALLKEGELFEGELISALGQGGAIDEGCRGVMEEIAFNADKPEAARLAAVRELAERFFDAETCARIGDLVESAGSRRFRRNAFWFVARRVIDGDECAVELARRLLPVDRDLEPDVRWALAEGGDAEQAGYFLEVVGKGAGGGWQGDGGTGQNEDLPGYDNLVRAAQVLCKIGTPDAVGPLAELIRRDQAAGGVPPGSPFSLTEAAREAILSIRSAYGMALAEEETSVEALAGGEATVVDSVDEATRLEPVGEAAAFPSPLPANQDTRIEQAGEATVREPAAEETRIEPVAEETRIGSATGEAVGLSPDDVFGPQVAAEEAAIIAGEEAGMGEEDRREEEQAVPEEEGAGEAKPEEAEAEAPSEETRREEAERAALVEAQLEAARRLEEEARRAREAEEAEEARRAEEERKAEEERRAREAEEAEEARRAEEERKAREAQEAEEARRAEEERKAREAEEAEEARRAEEERKAREAQEAEEARRAEEERKAREAEEAEEARRAEEAAGAVAEEKVEEKPAVKAAKKPKKAAKKKAPKKKAPKKKAAKKKAAKKSKKKA